ncbi:hypothetical protein AVE30378_05052 [Achromobacter veterisilvae]|uniref:Uncharacterized protein n=1 Tax=Achromobacter veterisilvae TaxID=2069367 RepID=A0A446CWS2_9BURK|nr:MULTISPECIES: hypothetical protein [Achromobacter]MCW0206568.1 hypothetical protein [Achromobacter sp.]SSW72316.1 hypothetical protein AVE30378_05052 [Achromobacter veterisilvae]
MAADVGAWLALLGAAGCAALAWKAAARAGRGARLRAACAACLGLSALCFYAWYAQYLKWDFNELGRHYDPVDQVVYTDAGFVWVLPAGALLIAGLLCAWRAGRR